MRQKPASSRTQRSEISGTHVLPTQKLTLAVQYSTFEMKALLNIPSVFCRATAAEAAAEAKAYMQPDSSEKAQQESEAK